MGLGRSKRMSLREKSVEKSSCFTVPESLKFGSDERQEKFMNFDRKTKIFA